MSETDYSVPPNYIAAPTNRAIADTNSETSLLYNAVITDNTVAYLPDKIGGKKITPELKSGVFTGHVEVDGNGGINFTLYIHDTVGGFWYVNEVSLLGSPVWFDLPPQLNRQPGELITLVVPIYSDEGAVLTTDHWLSHDQQTWVKTLEYIDKITYLKVDHQVADTYNSISHYDITVNDVSRPLTVISKYPDAPVIDAVNIRVNENIAGSLQVRLLAGESDMTYSLSGVDAKHFSINETTGRIDFKYAFDYEMPVDDDGDNVYTFTVTADNGFDSNEETFSVAISNIIDLADPEFTVDPVLDAELDTQYYVRGPLHGPEDGAIITSDNVQLSNDNGVTWITGGLTFISGQTLFRFSGRSAKRPNLPISYPIKISNTVRYYTIITKHIEQDPVKLQKEVTLTVVENSDVIGMIPVTQGIVDRWISKDPRFSVTNGYVYPVVNDILDYERLGNRYDIVVIGVDVLGNSSKSNVTIKVVDSSDDSGSYDKSRSGFR